MTNCGFDWPRLPAILRKLGLWALWQLMISCRYLAFSAAFRSCHCWRSGVRRCGYTRCRLLWTWRWRCLFQARSARLALGVVDYLTAVPERVHAFCTFTESGARLFLLSCPNVPSLISLHCTSTADKKKTATVKTVNRPARATPTG